MRWDGLGWIHRWEGVGGKEGVSLMHNFHFHVVVAGRLSRAVICSCLALLHVNCTDLAQPYFTLLYLLSLRFYI